MANTNKPWEQENWNDWNGLHPRLRDSVVALDESITAERNRITALENMIVTEGGTIENAVPIIQTVNGVASSITRNEDGNLVLDVNGNELVFGLERPILNGNNVALSTDGFLFRLSRSFPSNINIGAGTRYNLLSSFNLATDIQLSANIDSSAWYLNNGTLIFPAIEGYVDYSYDIRLYGTVAGGGGSVRDFHIELVRQNAGTTASSRSVTLVGTTDLSSKSVVFETYTLDLTDPFIDGGVRTELNNTSGQQLSLSRIDVVIKGTRH